ncbi:MAG TPA: SDR family NAD(P)-dependent oxidoreductase [bacterium]|nr:SDR family NAD(P)-dependent oxidoreductase [bacterium]
MKLSKRMVAVITGGASGIGRAMAIDLARCGLNLVLADVEATPLARTAEEVAALGATVLAVPTDVSDRGSVQALADAAYERFEAVHVLCNNAGVAIGGPLQDARHEDWQWLIGVNLWGVIHGVEAFVPRMIAGGKPGHIVNTASMAGLIASAGLGIYNTTKYAVVGLSETLSKDLRDTKLGVSVLCPMGVQTRITESERNRPEDLGEKRAERGAPQLLGRYLAPEEVSAMVMQAIEHERLYIPTHYEGLEFWDRRAQRVHDAFPGPSDDQ